MKTKDIMKCAFEIMMAGAPVILNKEGKRELERCWEGSSKTKWHIQHVSCNDEITICSENHLIFKNASLDYFNWKPEVPTTKAKLKRAEAQRDELLKLCKLVMKSTTDGSFVVASNWWLKMEDLIKSITKSND